VRIKQCYLATPVKHSGIFKSIYDMYGLKPYKDPKKPCIFFGLYTHVDLNKLKKHKAKAVVVWCGSDIMRKKNVKLAIKKDVKHIVLSNFMARDLDKYDVEYEIIPIIASPAHQIQPTKLGNEIYTYVPKKSGDLYGKRFVKKIKKLCKFKINIITSHKSYTRKKLFRVYDKCFCGLRLTSHDGVANTVVELGMKGRRCIYNGSAPNAIPWDKNNIEDIIEKIDNESKLIGTVNNKVHQAVKEYISIGKDWLTTDHWWK